MPDSTPDHPSRGSSSAGDEGASGSDATQLDLAAAEAEAEAAQAAATAAAAEATAAAARARAARLRRDVEVGERPASSESPNPSATVTLSKATETPALDAPPERAARSQRLSGSARKIAVSAAIVVIFAAFAATGYMTYQHQQAESDRDQSAEYAAAAKQGVVTLTSLDFNNAQADIQRVLDNSTGEFRDDFQNRKDDFTTVVQQSKVATEGQVNATAVESMTDDSAVVLVSSTSKVSNSAGAQQEPRVWRLSVTVTREGDQIKMSKVDFVP
jgi:Mce-associated membrane protein